MTRLAGVVGNPIEHSLSPLIFRAWIEAAGLDAIYAPFAPPMGRFEAFVEGMRQVVCGLNVTAPFKLEALAMAERASERARRAGAANLLRLADDGSIAADNTDGEGTLAALRRARPELDIAAAPAVILGAGGAARGAAAILVDEGAPAVRILARRYGQAQALAGALGPPVIAVDEAGWEAALAGAGVIIQATPIGQGGDRGPDAPLERAAPGAVALDMVYRPLRTEFLDRAEALGLTPAFGIDMLIGQAEPSFTVMFGCPPPSVDVRSLALAKLQ